MLFRSVLVEDVATATDFIAAIPGLKSEVCVPVWAAGEVIGVVNVESRAVLAEEVVQEVEQAAGALGRAVERLGGLPAATLAERLARVSVELAEQSDAGQALQRATRAALELSRSSGAAVARTDGEGRWRVAEVQGALSPVLGGWDHDVLDFLSGWVVAGTASYFPGGEAPPPGYGFLGNVVESLAVHPLSVAGSMTGLLVVADVEPTAHDPRLAATLEMLAAQTAAVVTMLETLERLEEQANRDPLTVLLNRRGFVKELERAAGRAQPEAASALVLIDLDGFKGVNDAHGHAMGDAVLQEVAHALEASARDGDLVARLGGDEFAVLVRDCASREDGFAVAERLVRAVEAVRTEGCRAVGASAGLRMISGGTASGLLVEADLALYAAKRAGRGRAMSWPLVASTETGQRTPKR